MGYHTILGCMILYFNAPHHLTSHSNCWQFYKFFGVTRDSDMWHSWASHRTSFRSLKNGKKKTKKKKRKKKENTDENSGHYVIASSRPPERQPLERRTLAPKEYLIGLFHYLKNFLHFFSHQKYNFVSALRAQTQGPWCWIVGTCRPSPAGSWPNQTLPTDCHPT